MPSYVTAKAARATAAAPRPRPRPASRQRASTDDDVVAGILIAMRSLATGRHLRSDVPPQQLSEEELIAFWADDLDAG